MAVLNPPIAIQSRADHNADDLRGALGAAWTSAGNTLTRGGILPGSGANNDALTVAAAAPAAMSVVVSPGSVFIPAPTAGHGGYVVTNDAALTLPIAAAHATLPRTDRVIARVADPQYWAGGDGLAAIKVITGTPNVGAPVPDIPALEGGYYELARVNVTAGLAAVVAANVLYGTAASGRALTVAAGGILPVYDDGQRLALPNPYPGLVVHVRTLNALWLYSATGWTPLAAPTSGDVLGAAPTSWAFGMGSGSPPVPWNLTANWNRYTRSAGFVRATGLADLGDNGPAFGGTNNASCTLPFNLDYPTDGMAIGTWVWSDYSGNTSATGVIRAWNAGATYGWRGLMCNAAGVAAIGTSYRFRMSVNLGYYTA